MQPCMRRGATSDCSCNASSASLYRVPRGAAVHGSGPATAYVYAHMSYQTSLCLARTLALPADEPGHGADVNVTLLSSILLKTDSDLD